MSSLHLFMFTNSTTLLRCVYASRYTNVGSGLLNKKVYTSYSVPTC